MKHSLFESTGYLSQSLAAGELLIVDKKIGFKNFEMENQQMYVYR